jgi:DNA-binding XRE family transcriptional regulator
MPATQEVPAPDRVIEVNDMTVLPSHHARIINACLTSGPVILPVTYQLPHDVSSRFGLRLRELRKERNMTQLRMATDFGIDRSYISDVERGRKSISLPMLEVIALGLEISLSDLLRDL